MALEVLCPECGETLTLSSAADRRKRLRCPDCDHVFRPSGKKSAPPAGMPKWVPFAAGGLVLAVVGVVLAVVLTGKSDPPVVAKNPPVVNPPVGPPPGPQPPIVRPDPRPRPQPQPEPEPEPEPPVIPPPPPVIPPPPITGPDKPNPNPQPPVARPLPPRMEPPPLPPPGQRPVLVLDPGSHTARIRSVAFTADGKKFVTGSDDKTIRVWDAATGSCLRTIHMPNGGGNEGVINTVAVSPNGKWIAAGGFTYQSAVLGEHLSFLIPMDGGEVVRTFGGHTNVVNSLSFSADGRLLASGSTDKSVRVYQVATGQLVAQLTGHKGTVTRVRFAPKGGRFATASTDGTGGIWVPQPNGQYAATQLVSGPNAERLNDVLWTADGKTVVTGGGDGAIRTWTDAGKLIRTYDKYEIKVGNDGKTAPVQITSMALTRDGKEVVAGGVAAAGEVFQVNLAEGTVRAPAAAQMTNTVMACAASPTADMVIMTGGNDNEFIGWRPSDGSRALEVHSGGKSVWAVATDKSSVIAFGNVNRGGSLPMTRPVTTAFDVAKLDFVPVPLATAWPAQPRSGPYGIRLADFYTVDVTKGGQPHFPFAYPEASQDRIYSATLLPDTTRMVVGSAFQLVLVDLETKKTVRKFAAVGGIVTTLAPTKDGLIVAGFTDQTIRVYNPDRDEPILSLFFVNREWIAWTPEGYYAASPGGERLMGWQVNNGPKKLGKYFSAIQFRDSLYQPAVIRSLFEAKGDLGLAMAIAVRDTKRPVPAVNLSQVLPPAVAITSPKAAEDGDLTSDKETLEVTATAKGDGKYPVKAMRLLVDGRPYQGEKGIKLFPNPKAGEVTAKWSVSLPPGRHTLIAQADNGSSKGLSSVVEVAQAGEDKLPNLYVYAVGVNAYPGKMKLNFAKPDAESIVKVLKERTDGVFANVQAKLVTDQQATKAEILAGLDWMNSVMTPRDVGVFYFSGHGASDEQGEFHLVPVDVSQRDVVRSCIHGDVVRNKLANMPGRLVAIFDACHSGGAADSMRAGRTDGLVRELLTDDCGVVVLCSSMGDEVSLESSQTKAGFFTFGLVEGLSGKADLNGDGLVHIDEATLFASLRVKQLSSGTQNPTLGRSPHLKPFPLTKK